MAKERYKNLREKYGITVEELDNAIDQINLGKVACEGIVLVALCELLVSGDINLQNWQLWKFDF